MFFRRASRKMPNRRLLQKDLKQPQKARSNLNWFKAKKLPFLFVRLNLRTALLCPLLMSVKALCGTPEKQTTRKERCCLTFIWITSFRTICSMILDWQTSRLRGFVWSTCVSHALLQHPYLQYHALLARYWRMRRHTQSRGLWLRDCSDRWNNAASPSVSGAARSSTVTF